MNEGEAIPSSGINNTDQAFKTPWWGWASLRLTQNLLLIPRGALSTVFLNDLLIWLSFPENCECLELRNKVLLIVVLLACPRAEPSQLCIELRVGWKKREVGRLVLNDSVNS